MDKKNRRMLRLVLGICLAAGAYDSPVYAAAQVQPAGIVQNAAEGPSEKFSAVQTQYASSIEKAVSITRVYGDGETAIAAALAYPKEIDIKSLSFNSFEVPGKEIVGIYTNDKAADTEQSIAGRYVILRFKYKSTANDGPLKQKPHENAQQGERPDGEAPMRSDHTIPDCNLNITQQRAIRAVDGTVYNTATAAVHTTAVSEPDLNGFQQYVYTDPATGYQMPYSLFLPQNYDPTKKYPLMVFIPDASANINFDKMPLVQGNGAVIWASAEEQRKHPCIVLAAQYTQNMVDQLGMMTTDKNVWTQGLELAKDLIFDIKNRYSVDADRIYGTGQSQGGMANIAISDRYPDLFAAQYLVACQWNVDEMAAMKNKNLWIVVCEGDTKAYPGMNAATALWQRLGTKVAESHGWDSKAQPEELAYRTELLEREKAPINYTTFTGGNHMYTWTFAYDIEPIRDWIFTKTKSGKPSPYQGKQRAMHNDKARKDMETGLAYYQGSTVQQDYHAALDCFKKAFDEGDFKAGRYIGLCYEKGYGVQKDDKKAAQWYEKAAERNDITAAYYLGECYEQGRGVQQDYQKALVLYLKAGARGDKIAAPAMKAAANLYAKGLGTQQDLEKARYYYDKAANAQ